MDEARVDIVDAATGEVVDRCHGPTRAGLCPRRDVDGVVPCSGRRIVPLGAGPERWQSWVPASSHVCPLAAAEVE